MLARPKRELQAKRVKVAVVAVAVAAAALLLPSAVKAKPGKEIDRGWVFLPVVDPELTGLGAPSELVSPFEVGMRERGERVIYNREAAEVVRSGHSVEPPQPLAAQGELRKALRDARRALAAGSLTRAQALLQPVAALSPGERDAFASDPAIAKQLLATCLTEVHLLQRQRGDSAAGARSRECLTAFPNAITQASEYPPELQALLERVAVGGAQLRVTSKSRTCRVFLNGVDVGVTPLSLERLEPVRARVQLDCGGTRGRVHPVELGAGVVLDIDHDFDVILRTVQGLSFLGADDAKYVGVLGGLLQAKVVVLRFSSEPNAGALRAVVEFGERKVAAIAYPPRPRNVDNALELLRHVEPQSQAIERNLPARSWPLDPSPAAPAAAAPRQVPVDTGGVSSGGGSDGVPWGPVFVGSAGVLMLGGAVITGVMGHERDEAVRSAERRLCEPDVPPCDLSSVSASTRGDIASAQREVSSLYAATNTLLIAGGVAVAGALVWWLVLPSDDADDFTLRAGDGDIEARLRVRF